VQIVHDWMTDWLDVNELLRCAVALSLILPWFASPSFNLLAFDWPRALLILYFDTYHHCHTGDWLHHHCETRLCPWRQCAVWETTSWRVGEWRNGDLIGENKANFTASLHPLFLFLTQLWHSGDCCHCWIAAAAYSQSVSSVSQQSSAYFADLQCVEIVVPFLLILCCKGQLYQSKFLRQDGVFVSKQPAGLSSFNTPTCDYQTRGEILRLMICGVVFLSFFLSVMWGITLLCVAQFQTRIQIDSENG